MMRSSLRTNSSFAPFFPVTILFAAIIVMMDTTHSLAQTAVQSSELAQNDTLRANLEEIRVEVSRSSSSPGTTPFSLSLWQRPESQRLSTPATGIDQVIGYIPGIYISNRDNYSLGERLSVRGMGWRAAFGVRGVQVLLDGIPLTSPDGQTILEIVDPNMIRSVEAIRGPAAIFWGNGSGGTLFFSTEGSSDDPSISIRTFAGAYETLQSDVRVRTSVGKIQATANVSDFRTKGYRYHSRATIQRAGLSLSRPISATQRLSYTGIVVVAPDIQNPGSLNQAQLEVNRSSANPVFVSQGAGKSYTHIMQGARFNAESGPNRYELVVHGTVRDLNNPIQNSIIRVNRLSGGVRSSFQRQISPNLALLTSADAAIQSDRRRNWVNVTGNKGAMTVRQQETLQTAGLATILNYQIGRFGVQGGVRQDWMFFSVDDQFGGVTDASGDRLLHAFTPQIGATVDLGGATLFGGVSTAFESPTTTELANRPDLARGFNPDLNPERSVGIESGIRGYWASGRLRYETVVYRIDIRDRLLSYQTQAGGDRNFFENAGKSRHQGVEVAAQWTPLAMFALNGSYTYNDLRIRSSENNLQQKRIPGIPVHRGNIAASLTIRKVTLTADLRHHGEMFANNANTVKNEAFTVADVRIASKHSWTRYEMTISPFAQVRNVTNQTYNNSVSINAFGGRFFEPAAPRGIYAGLAIQFL
jgi:iron complex outermembrane recepter protein